MKRSAHNATRDPEPSRPMLGEHEITIASLQREALTQIFKRDLHREALKPLALGRLGQPISTRPRASRPPPAGRPRWAGYAGARGHGNVTASRLAAGGVLSAFGAPLPKSASDRIVARARVPQRSGTNAETRPLNVELHHLFAKLRVRTARWRVDRRPRD
jgi:hypothetical protein